MPKYKEIKEFPGYFVGADGTVLNRCAKQLVYNRDIDGYVRVRLSKNGKRTHKKTAVLVLQCFVGPRPAQSHQAAHKDGNKENNHLSNLYWATPKENTRDKKSHGTMYIPEPSHPGETNGRSKLTEKDVKQIRKEYSNWTITQHQLADRFDVSDVQISMIVNRKLWKHI